MRRWYWTTAGLLVASAALAPLACGDDETAALAAAGGAGGSTNIGGFMTGPSASSTSSTGGSGTGGMGTVGFIWDNTFGGTGSLFPKDLAVDSAGNIVVVGAFTGVVNLGGTDLTASGTEVDIFVAKYDAAGAHVWSSRYGAADVHTALGVDVDSQNAIWLCGHFKGGAAANFGFGGPTLSTGESQFTDVWVAKLDASGAHVFSAAFPNTPGTPDECHGVAVDGSDNVWLAGGFATSINFGTPLTATGGAGDRDVFLVKLSPAGAHLQSARHGSSDVDLAMGVAADGNNVAIVGESRNAPDFGGGMLMHGSAGQPRGFVARYDTMGAHGFSKLFNGSGDGRSVGLAFGATGELWAVGSFRGSIDPGGGSVDAMGPNDDVFVARYDTSGGVVWQNRFGDVDSEQATDIAVDAQGFAIVSGKFNGQWTPLVGTTLTTAGGFDGFLLRLGSAGNGYWAFAFGDTAADEASAVAIDGNRMVATGSFSGNPDLGSGPVMGTNAQAMFVAKYSD